MQTSAKRKRGGSRKGKPNKSTAEVKHLIDLAAKEHGGMQFVFEKLFELVAGVTIQTVDKKGEEHVYDKPPDAFAAKILLEYRYGKAPQPITGPEGESLLEAIKVLIVKK